MHRFSHPGIRKKGFREPRAFLHIEPSMLGRSFQIGIDDQDALFGLPSEGFCQRCGDPADAFRALQTADGDGRAIVAYKGSKFCRDEECFVIY